jgi:hypothetical protein
MRAIVRDTYDSLHVHLRSRITYPLSIPSSPLTLSCLRKNHFTILDKELKKFEVTHNLGSIAPSALVPIPQPDQRNDLFG